MNATLSMADMTDTSDGSQHRDVRPTENRKGEWLVKKATDAVNSFLNPLDSMTKINKMKGSKNKVFQFKEQGTIAFKFLLFKSQNEGVQLDMKELMSYPLTTVPFSLATGNIYS